MESEGSRGTKQKKMKAKAKSVKTNNDSDSDMDLWDEFDFPGHQLPVQPCSSPSSTRWTRKGTSNAPLLKPHRSKEAKVTGTPTDDNNFVNLCLAYYKEKKGVDYELVHLVGQTVINRSVGWGTHINFFARLKGTNSSPEFFFADIKYAPNEVLHCCKLTPAPYNFGETHPPDVFIFHCPHVECLQCAALLNYFYHDDSEEDVIDI
ncbi:uncharacterized protein LOC110738486 [Chenopodium quinoa]|uniref:uncharacterized protein LOC110738486 n=1 Tax=Chenopodium quinoa TaxID=63459 RepID=UPI000B772AD8|nr:uncharacterized protein LOC110738486 [Chenopodium quinoa]